MVVLLAMALSVAALARASHASAATAPEQLGREFCAHQEGVDEADSFLLEWEVFLDTNDSEPDAVYLVAWKEERIFNRHESLRAGRTSTAVVTPDHTVTLTAAEGSAPEAALYDYPHPGALRAWPGCSSPRCGTGGVTSWTRRDSPRR